MSWTVRLYEAAPAKRYAVYFSALLAALFGWALFQEPVLPAVGFVAILAATAEFWLPLHYKIDENRAAVRCGISLTAIEWADIRRIVMANEGWKLSPLAEETRLSPFRGVFLRFPPEPNAVQEYVRSHIGEDVRFVEHRTEPG